MHSINVLNLKLHSKLFLSYTPITGTEYEARQNNIPIGDDYKAVKWKVTGAIWGKQTIVIWFLLILSEVFG